MVPNIYCKEKVVSNGIALLFVFILQAAFSQSAIDQNRFVTFTVKHADLQTTIDQLSRVSGLHFIYSSDKIKAKESFSFSVVNKPLEEALSLAGKQMKLDFRRNGQYVIIKPMTYKPITFTMHQPEQRFTASIIPVRSYFSLPIEETRVRTTHFVNSDSLRLQRYITLLQPYFDSTWLKRIPPKYVQNLNRTNKHRGWFVAIGPMFNDYSSGLEIQAGLRSLYAVYNPTWLRNGNQFHGSYGIGSTILLGHTLSIHPVYTFSAIHWKYPEEFAAPNIRMPYQLNVDTRHHQFKTMLRYSFTPNLMLQAGPTFNRAATRFSFTKEDMFILKNWSPSIKQGGAYHNAQEAGTTTYGEAIPNSVFPIHSAPSSFENVRYWVGVEAALLIRINFQQR